MSPTPRSYSTFFSCLDQLVGYCLKSIVRGYRLFFGHLTFGCRFHPTCSRYALEAIETHGGLKGLMLTIKRISRCHPWGGAGVDDVPTKVVDKRK